MITEKDANEWLIGSECSCEVKQKNEKGNACNNEESVPPSAHKVLLKPSKRTNIFDSVKLDPRTKKGRDFSDHFAFFQLEGGGTLLRPGLLDDVEDGGAAPVCARCLGVGPGLGADPPYALAALPWPACK